MKKWNWNNPITWKKFFAINIVSSILAVAAILASLVSYDQYWKRIKNAWSGSQNKESEEKDN